MLLILPLSASVITQIQVEGNQRITKETALFYFGVTVGEEYSDTVVEEGFRKLWATGFFDDIRITKEENPQGLNLTLHVKERLVLKEVIFSTKGIGKGDIEKRLEEKNLKLQAYSYFDPYKLKRAEHEIRALMTEKNYADSDVKSDVKVENNQVTLTLSVRKGAAVKIDKIRFAGNNAIPSFKLKWAMKVQRQNSFLFSIFSKDRYSKEKMEEALENIKEAYYNKGYLQAKIGEPKLEYVVKRDAFFKKRKMVQVTIPISEGSRYRIGDISVAGNKVLPSELIKAIFKVKKSNWYSLKKKKEGVTEIQKAYGDLGYFYCNIAPEENLDLQNKNVNLTLQVQENEKAYLRYLSFQGNNYTKDFVLRRELFLQEGEIFSTGLFEQSLRRMKQLGLVDLKEMPDVKPDEKDPSQVDLNVKVEELGRNMIQFSGGYSGYDGTFVMFSYSTVNFMGAGEQLSLSAQYGERSKNYSFGFTEPYVFNLPMTAGFTIFKRSTVYPYLFDRRGEGVDLTLAARLYRYWNGSLTYSFEKIDVRDVSDLFNSTDPYYYYYYQAGKRTYSSLTPNVYYSTVDSPLEPTTGTLYGFSVKYSGKILGGDVHLLKPRLEFTKYIKGFSRKHVFGVHFETSFIKSLEGGESKVPYYERFFLGGERSVRGFEIYSIAPTDSNGYILGGTKMVQLNLEYKVPMGAQSPLSLIFFADAANTWAPGVKADLGNLYSSLGGEIRVFVPMLRVPFRLIFAYNPKQVTSGEDPFQIRFGIGPTF